MVRARIEQALCAVPKRHHAMNNAALGRYIVNTSEVQNDSCFDRGKRENMSVCKQVYASQLRNGVRDVKLEEQ